MNDAFDVVGAPLPDQDLTIDSVTPVAADPKPEFTEPSEVLADEAAEVAEVVEAPNGFQKMGLRPAGQ